jgi:thiol-disulfide isomerase/thioredoxin
MPTTASTGAPSVQSHAKAKIERTGRKPNPDVCAKNRSATVLSSKAVALGDMSFSDTGGNKFTLKTWMNARKKPVLLVFWAPWCGPCMDEMPSLAIMSKKLASLLNVVPISVSPITNGQGCLQENLQKYDIPLYHSSDSKTIDPLVNSIPAFFLIDTNGEILMESCGKRNWESQEEQNALCAHITKKPTKKPIKKPCIKDCNPSVRPRTHHRNPS